MINQRLSENQYIINMKIDFAKQFYAFLQDQIEKLQSLNTINFIHDYDISLKEFNPFYMSIDSMKAPVKNVELNVTQNATKIVYSIFADDSNFIEFNKIEDNSYEMIVHAVAQHMFDMQNELFNASRSYFYGYEYVPNKTHSLYAEEYRNDYNLLSKNSNTISERQKHGKMFYDFLVKYINPIQKVNKVILLHKTLNNHYIFSHGWNVKKNIRKIISNELKTQNTVIICNLEKNDTTSFEFKDNEIVARVEEKYFDDIIVSMKWASSLYMYDKKWEPDTSIIDVLNK